MTGPQPDRALHPHATIDDPLVVVEQFSAAWSRADVDTLMALMSDEPTYRASTGPGPGAVYRGRDAVRAAFERLLGDPPPVDDAPSPLPEVVMLDHRAVSYWSIPGTAPDGTPATIEGIDVLTFDADGRITEKDSYRKAWST